MKTYSQYEQDIFLLEKFKNITTGFFVDIGANDGITYSNTKRLEEMGWDGICIEPLPDAFNKLKHNRTCKCINGAISSSLKSTVEFCEIKGYAEMLSGIIDEYDERHKRRIINELKAYGGEKNKITVNNYTFSDLIGKSNKHIDLLCIDTEGSELSILKSIDFNSYTFSCIAVENNYGENNVKNFLNTKGYRLITTIGADEMYENNI